MLLSNKIKRRINPYNVLYLGTKIPEYIDGKVLENALKDGLTKLNRIGFASVQQDRDLTSMKKKVYSKKEMEQVKKHLADLGYV